MNEEKAEKSRSAMVLANARSVSMTWRRAADVSDRCATPPHPAAMTQQTISAALAACQAGGIVFAVDSFITLWIMVRSPSGVATGMQRDAVALAVAHDGAKTVRADRMGVLEDLAAERADAT